MASHREALDRALESVEGLLTPGILGEAPLAESTGNPILCRAWTALGLPVLHLPTGRGPRGLPVGVQVIGSRGNDGQLISPGQWLSTAFASGDS
ncbi:MAG: hypothetical protein ACFCBW_14655 [Candidatus Competibacterales bacterium]